tara:strand:+ start:3515 stop:3676 length:162 start_codon:yes stop_codon:yes gene_type:complete
MTKLELIFLIARKMNSKQGAIESFNAYKCIKGYFLDLDMDDLIAIANQYGIEV